MQKEIKIIILVYAILVVAKALLSLLIPSPTVFADSYFYIKLARSIFLNQNLVVHNVLSLQYFPLYPIIQSITYIFSDMQIVYMFMKFLNAIIITTTLFPIYLIARDFLTRKKALSISIVISLLALLFNTPNYILSENLFYPLVAFTFFFLYKAFTKNRSLFFILAGVFVGLAYLNRVVALAILPVCLIVYFFHIKKTKWTNILLHYIFAAILMLPWVIRNGALYGFNLKTPFGAYQGTAQLATKTGSFIIPFINWIINYFGFIILASGVIFAIYYLLAFKLKDQNLKSLFLISITSMILLIIMAAKAAASGRIVYTSIFSSIFTYRPQGRFIDVSILLVILIGYIVYTKIKQPKLLKVVLPISIILGISTQLTTTPLFPFNNQSISLLGIFKTALDAVVPSLSLILIFIILLAIPWLVYLRKYKKLLLTLAIILLVLNTAAALTITVWNSNSYWADTPSYNLGLWINDNIDNSKTIVFDERDCDRLFRTNQAAICEQFSNNQSATIIGYWTNNNLKVGNINKSADYIISKHKLNLSIAYQEQDFYLYSNPWE